jgi:hypothetical protein
MDKGDGSDLEKSRSARFPVVEIAATSAQRAYDDVLAYAGASFRRDSLDARIINDVKKRKGRIIDVQGGYPHGTAYEQTQNAWPALRSLPAKTDSDEDGMPDEWEKMNKLDPGNASDAALFTLHKSYSNIEVYINSLK